MNFTGLDLETAPEAGHPQPFALQPWRATEGLARITCMSVAEPNTKPELHQNTEDKIPRRLNSLIGSNCVTWNGVFDIAWLIASGHLNLVKNINWFDAMLLWKWVDNSQQKEYFDPHWSLVDGAKHWLKDVPWIDHFIDLKAHEPPAGERDDYWELRAKFDALATQLIADRAWWALTKKQRNSATIEAQCLVPTAQSWLRGIPLDTAMAEKMVPEVTQEMREIEYRLGVSNFQTEHGQPEIWTASKILSSPKQLAQTLYDTWGLPCDHHTPKGAPSTDKTALTYLADIDDKALEILRWRELNTQFTKFIQGTVKSHSSLGSCVSHPGPRLFSAYTGRMTYSTKSGRKGDAAKFKVGVPIHQWPRPKLMRRMIHAPEGKALVELDAAGQEARLIAQLANEEAMMRVFNTCAHDYQLHYSNSPPDDIHSYTGSKVAGISFEAFLKGKEQGVKAIVGPRGYRYQGKFMNLSYNYRIGAKSSRRKARVDYGMNVDIQKAIKWKDTYLRTYRGIKKYWGKSIEIAKTLGYAESLAGRRFALTQWHGEKKWATEQSAINFPIQGSGGDQKELALMILTAEFPELEFAFDLHDGLFFYVDINPQLPEIIMEARNRLNEIDYESAWGWRPQVPMLWDASVGVNWGQMKELK